jgi:hypothetical protein
MPFFEREEVLGVHAKALDVIIDIFYDIGCIMLLLHEKTDES